MRKDLEVQALSSKLEDEQGFVGRVQKGIKENQSRTDEMEDEPEAERQARGRPKGSAPTWQGEVLENQVIVKYVTMP